MAGLSQRCHAPSLTVLAIGDIAPQPWSNIVDRAFLDPATASIYFDVAPSTSPLVRTFPIPPGLPAGLTVALQGFELPTTGAVSSSNVTFAGIW